MYPVVFELKHAAGPTHALYGFFSCKLCKKHVTIKIPFQKARCNFDSERLGLIGIERSFGKNL
jgi:hypothetical protein